MKILGAGYGRVVIEENNKTVIKKYLSEYGKYQNQTEYYIYMHASDEQKEIICPVIDLKDGILEMYKAKPLDRLYPELKTIQEYYNVTALYKLPFWDKLKSLMDDFNLARGDIEKLSSWGLFNNKIVLIDYGTTSFDLAYLF